MKIAVMGSGGIGGYFGAHLALQESNDVWFIARGPHLEAIKNTGLQIRSEQGDITVFPAQATDDPAEVGPVDLIIFAVKLYGMDAAAEQCRPMVAADTGIVCLQNGIGSEERVDQILGEGHAIGGIVYAPLAIEAPGIIRHEGKFARLVLGEMSGEPSARLEKFLNACHAAGIVASASGDMKLALWEKFVFLASFAGITCLTRQPSRCMQQDSDTFELFLLAVREAIAVAQAEGVNLNGEDVLNHSTKMAQGLAENAQSSMLTDFESGKALENAWFSGKILELGRLHNIPTPVHHAFYCAMRPFQDGTG
jgi:2-dehydropantoate 2-reductase